MPSEQALGVQWRIETNKLGFNINVKLRPLTCRGISSVVGTVFDLFGFVAPFVLTAKKILQDLCQINLSWDDEIPAEYCECWQRWLKDLPKLSQFKIDRCLINQPTFATSCPISCISFQTHFRLVLDRSRISACLIVMESHVLCLSNKLQSLLWSFQPQ